MEKQYIVPSFYDKFSCLGGACGYTCCQSWAIYMTKRDYKDLMKQRVSSDLKGKLHLFAGRVNDEKLNDRLIYASVRMDENDQCPLLTEEGFCGLQIECGPQTLPSICKSFPRFCSYIIDDVGEINLRLACEATARLLVEETVPIRFDIQQKSFSTQNGAYIFSNKMLDNNPLLLHYWDIKALAVGIMQNRFYTLPQRILYLGFVVKRLMEYETAERLAEVRTLLQGLMEQEDSEALRQSLEQLPVDHNLSAVMQTVILRLKNDKGYTKLYERAINAIGTYDEEQDSATIQPPIYQEKRKQFEAFCEKYPHVMENIAVQQLHEMAMPFGGIYFGNMQDEKLDMWKNYLFFCWRISMIQFLLGALVTLDTSLNEVALMVSIIARQFPNTYEGALTCVGIIEKADITTIEQLSILLKG